MKFLSALDTKGKIEKFKKITTQFKLFQLLYISKIKYTSQLFPIILVYC